MRPLLYGVACLVFGALMAGAHMSGHAIEGWLIAAIVVPVGALLVWDRRSVTAARRKPPEPSMPAGNTLRVDELAKQTMRVGELAEQTILDPADETRPK